LTAASLYFTFHNCFSMLSRLRLVVSYRAYTVSQPRVHLAGLSGVTFVLVLTLKCSHVTIRSSSYPHLQFPQPQAVTGIDFSNVIFIVKSHCKVLVSMQDQRTQVVSILILSLLSPLIVGFFFLVTPFDVTFYTPTLSTKGL